MLFRSVKDQKGSESPGRVGFHSPAGVWGRARVLGWPGSFRYLPISLLSGPASPPSGLGHSTVWRRYGHVDRFRIDHGASFKHYALSLFRSRLAIFWTPRGAELIGPFRFGSAGLSDRIYQSFCYQLSPANTAEDRGNHQKCLYTEVRRLTSRRQRAASNSC